MVICQHCNLSALKPLSVVHKVESSLPGSLCNRIVMQPNAPSWGEDSNMMRGKVGVHVFIPAKCSSHDS